MLCDGPLSPNHNRAREKPKDCIFCGYWKSGIFHDMCIDVLDIREREDLVNKIKDLITIILSNLERLHAPSLHHYINNLLCSYLTIAVDLPKENSDAEFIESHRDMLHKLHRLIYQVYRLFEFWDERQKVLFCETLRDAFVKKNFGSEESILRALEAAEKTTTSKKTSPDTSEESE